MAVLGVDVGGTFTDAVLIADGELRTAKVRTAERQEESVLAAAQAVGADELERFRTGRRSRRTRCWNGRARGRRSWRPRASSTSCTCVGRTGRTFTGSASAILSPWCRSSAATESVSGGSSRTASSGRSTLALPARREAVAVCLLFSFRDRAMGALWRKISRQLPSAHVVASREVSPEFRGTSGPRPRARTHASGLRLGSYLRALGGRCAEAGLQAARDALLPGGVASLEEAAARHAWALLSGPAGGVVGAARMPGSPVSPTRSPSTWVGRRRTSV